jgi:hypothetical protein
MKGFRSSHFPRLVEPTPRSREQAVLERAEQPMFHPFDDFPALYLAVAGGSMSDSLRGPLHVGRRSAGADAFPRLCPHRCHSPCSRLKLYSRRPPGERTRERFGACPIHLHSLNGQRRANGSEKHSTPGALAAMPPSECPAASA